MITDSPTNKRGVPERRGEFGVTQHLGQIAEADESRLAHCHQTDPVKHHPDHESEGVEHHPQHQDQRRHQREVSESGFHAQNRETDDGGAASGPAGLPQEPAAIRQAPPQWRPPCTA